MPAYNGFPTVTLILKADNWHAYVAYYKGVPIPPALSISAFTPRS